MLILILQKELSEKWEALQIKFKPVAEHVGVADDKMNKGEKCKYQTKEKKGKETKKGERKREREEKNKEGWY